MPILATLVLWGSFLFVGYLLAESLAEILRAFNLTDLLISCLIVGCFGLYLLTPTKQKSKVKRHVKNRNHRVHR